MGKSGIDRSFLSFPVLFQKEEDGGDGDVRFTKVKVWLMHLGVNANGSCFDKDVVDAALPTLQYIPIVAFIEDDGDGNPDCTGHRHVVVRDDNGARRKYMGSAYGVITSSDDNGAHYEDRLCDDGATRTFLVVEGLLWNMFEDCADIMRRDVVKMQSMELWDDGESIEGYEDGDGIFHFEKFSFRAACILGGGAEPAMLGSTIEAQFSARDFVAEIQGELEGMIAAYAGTAGARKNQGGIDVMPGTDFMQTAKEQLRDIERIVESREKIKDEWGYEWPRYCFVDVQEGEVIVTDAKDQYRFYGFPLSFDGDAPAIDFGKGERKKVRYEKFDGGSGAEPGGLSSFAKHIDGMKAAFSAKAEAAEGRAAEAKAACEAACKDRDAIKSEYDRLAEAERDRAKAEEDAAKDAEFAKYERALAGCAEFAELKAGRSGMSLDDVVSKCAILYARKSLEKSSFSKGGGQLRAGIPENGGDGDPGYVETKYGNIPVGR